VKNLHVIKAEKPLDFVPFCIRYTALITYGGGLGDWIAAAKYKSDQYFVGNLAFIHRPLNFIFYSSPD